ncbi:amino acid adenylation domain-containing protein [Brevibacillus sp. VP]|uniref:non-ribosomal peptide synthetase n=1 Tax=Brevibacillus sp. VP TaxID=2293326 RepID=UPI000E2EDF05|nr:non-ribosomal peptide synthetase [Brevibacillus sp. VP]RFB34921.1 amino acid adenylation domain-containing protein [Brevibacillus sp. VP]
MTTSKITENLILSNEKLEKEEVYWLDQMNGISVLSTFPIEFLRTSLDEFQKGVITYSFSEVITEKIRMIANQSPYAILTILATVLADILSRYTEAEDIVFSMPVFKQKKELKTVNKLLPLRIQVQRNEMTFKHLLMQMSKKINEASQNSNYPFHQIIKKSGLQVEDGIFPLCNTCIMLEDIHEKISVSQIKADSLFIFSQNKGNLQLTLEYNASLYSYDRMQMIVHHVDNYLSEVMREPDKSLMEISFLSEAERHQLLYDFNSSSFDYPRHKSVSQLFEDQVERTPDRIAVVFEGKQLTYRELNHRANQVAWFLHEQGVNEGTIVCFMVERSLELLIGILGIIKSGATYLQVDPDYPKERINYLLTHSQTSVILTQQKHKDNGNLKQARTFIIEDILTQSNVRTENLNLLYQPENLLYVLYTSGSTGNPKGAMIKHHSFVNLLYWHINKLSFSENERALLIAPSSFDLAQKNLFSVLLVGGRLIIYSPGPYDYRHMSTVIDKERITMINCAPSAFYPLVHGNIDDDFVKLSSIRHISLGGEPINMGNLQPWIKSPHFKAELSNTYGPTECTDISGYHVLNKEELHQITMVPVGKPIHNAKFYILDKYLQLLPPGIPGELCIGGEGVGNGYFNALELTNERFIDTPHLSVPRVYRTGDLMRWLKNGDLEFIGRIDHQVKIRGFRVELGEIESRLLQYPGMREVIVLDKTDEHGMKYLAAYFVSENEVTLDLISNFAQSHLPEYMIPSQFMQLPEFPLTPNGKINRLALTQLQDYLTSFTSYEVAKTPLEEELLRIWKNILKLEKIGIHDNFFRIGGHSLKAMMLVTILYKEFNVSLSIKQIFDNPTIELLAQLIEVSGDSAFIQIPLEPVEERPYYPISAAQKRMLIVDELNQGGTSYNIPSCVIIEGPVNPERFETALIRLIERHEALRTSFEWQGEEQVQRVHKQVKFQMSKRKLQEEEVIDLIREFVKPFHLSQAPLFRVGLYELGPDRYFLIMDMHHIISDGISMGILVEDVIDLYKGQELSPLPIQYKDFTHWQNQWFASEQVKKQELYWLDTFAGELPTLRLLTDYPRPRIRTNVGDRISFMLSKAESDELNRIVQDSGSTLYMILLAAYNILLFKCTGQEDIVVGTPVAGRQHADLERVVGMFINTLPMRNYPQDSKTFAEFFTEIKIRTLQAFDHQDYPFDALVEKLKIPRDSSRTPLFQTMFTLQNMNQAKIESEELTYTPYDFSDNTSKMDLSIIAVETPDGLLFDLYYSSNLFKRETAEILGQAYLQIMKQIPSRFDKTIASFELEFNSGERNSSAQTDAFEDEEFDF